MEMQLQELPNGVMLIVRINEEIVSMTPLTLSDPCVTTQTVINIAPLNSERVRPRWTGVARYRRYVKLYRSPRAYIQVSASRIDFDPRE